MADAAGKLTRKPNDAFGVRRLTRAERRSLALISILGTGVIWWGLSASGLVNPVLLPSPREVLDSFVQLMADGTLIKHIAASMSRVAMGFTLALATALPIGIAMGLSPIFRGLLEPLIELLRPIPPIAIIPLVMLWLGIGELSKTVIIAFGAFFPILVNTMAGFGTVDLVHVRAAQTLGANRLHILRDVILRTAFSSMVVGARLGMGLAFILLVAAELIASSEGLGYMINDARYRFNTAEIFLGMACIGCLGFLINQVLLGVERRLLRWKQDVN